MKKLIPLLILVGAVTAYSQGTVNYNNNVLTAPPDRLVRWASDGSAVTGTNYQAVLLYGASAGSLTPDLVPARFRVSTTGSPGTWQGGTRTLTGFNTGQSVTMQVVVFDILRDPNYASALANNRILGQSATFTYVVPSQPPAPGADSMVGFAGFTLVPEPSVIGLGLIGVGALFLLRRRK